MRFDISPVGDQSLLIQFGDTIDETVNRAVTGFAKRIREQDNPAILDMIPTYNALMISYDPARMSYQDMVLFLQHNYSEDDENGTMPIRTFHIPVCYGGEHGPDLEFIAEHAGLSVEEVIERHSGRDYRIYMIGFMPGFAYLGGLDEAIHTPRLEKPRLEIPGGSVGIGGASTGIYPLTSPGGWQLMGMTPVKPYDPSRNPAIIYEAGDFIRFVAIDEEEYDRILEEVETGTYTVTVEEGER